MYMTQSFKMVSQDTEPLKIELRDDNNNPYDLTGATGWLTIAQNVQPTTDQIIVKKALTISDPLNGVITVNFVTTDTANVAGVFPFDVVIMFPDGTRKTVIVGNFTIVANVTP